MLVVSIGCPSGIGPEVSVAAAARFEALPKVLVGDPHTIEAAARLVGVAKGRLARFEGKASDPSRIYVHAVGPRLALADRRPGRPSRSGGAAQLAWIDGAFDLVRGRAGRALVTGPVNKEAISRSGAPRASQFVGHTEWLCRRDRAKRSVMCFASDELSTSLVTTHLPLARVPRALSPAGVSEAIVELGRLLALLGHEQPLLAVCSLNPHAGEGELFGDEERRAIVPGIRAARRVLGRKARVLGPIGAETAYRKAAAGAYAGVVAMYHDQATIPMKLLSFGDAVNVTMGLSIVRTSVDHGTAYDIAWRGKADPGGMLAAMKLAAKLVRARPGVR